MPQGDIAHAQEARAAGVALLHHGRPDFVVLLGPAVAGRGPVQHVAVDVVGVEVLERAPHGLRHLSGKVGGGVVGQPVVLATLVRELRLQEEVRARDDPRAIGGGEPLAHAGLEVVPPLVGGVDATEAHPERELGEGRGAILLPGGAVEKIGNGCGVLRWHRVILPLS